MPWKVEEVDAITRNGKCAKFVRYNDSCWPTPYIFSINENHEAYYSAGGFINNHRDEYHELDLVGPWEDPLPKNINQILEEVKNNSGRFKNGNDTEMLQIKEEELRKILNQRLKSLIT